MSNKTDGDPVHPNPESELARLRLSTAAFERIRDAKIDVVDVPDVASLACVLVGVGTQPGPEPGECKCQCKGFFGMHRPGSDQLPNAESPWTQRQGQGTK